MSRLTTAERNAVCTAIGGVLAGESELPAATLRALSTAQDKLAEPDPPLARVYRLDWSDPEEGHCVAWADTWANVLAKKREVQKEFKRRRVRPTVTVSPLKVPKDAAGLAHWLNVYLTRGNG